MTTNQAFYPNFIESRWGQVPLVEFEGKSLTQSVAVTRYFAKKAKLVPEDMYQAALCDEYIDAARDFMSRKQIPIIKSYLYAINFQAFLIILYSVAFYGVIRETDESKRPEKLQEVLQTVKPKYFDVFEKIVKSNDGKHLVGTSLTWADVVLAYLFNHFHTLLGVDLTEGYPSLKKLVDNVTSTPAIKAWIDKRPKTQFW